MKPVEQLLNELTVEEKASLCSGKDFWTTKAIPRQGIPSWMMTDGPHGLRKQRSDAGEVGLLDSVPATCFPSGVGLASTWNPELVEEVGRALGKESRAEQVGVILGPAVNIKRSPLCGRNFEYFSEDPLLAGELAKSHIAGVQSQGVGASIKHFAVNNQEKFRMTIDAIVDERTLREIYLRAFEIAVQGAQPWTVMCSYNRVNGTYAAENQGLLTTILKNEWGHEGLVVTDWGANNDRVVGLQAGQDFEMPGNGGLTDQNIVEAVRSGRLSMETLDGAVRRILTITKKVVENIDREAHFDPTAHHALARRVATESLVLLKNSEGILPLQPGKSVAFLGALAKTPRYQGGGSSHILPTQMDDAVSEAKKWGHQVQYAEGYRLDTEESDQRLVKEAQNCAQQADVAVVFLGLTENFESEGFDRSHLGIPANHTTLLEEVLKVQPRVVVVLSNGSPVAMPWVDRVPAILESYLGGQAWGGAVVDILWGRANPSGKLAETFPVRLEDNPSYLHFPGDGRKVEYREGIFVGYRHYDALRLAPLYPFGHGLSYTTFAYGPLVADPTFVDGDTITVSTEVTNTGSRAGAEVVQLYVGSRRPSVVRPVRELKAFAKVSLDPRQSQRVTFSLDRRAFAHWSVEAHDWVVDEGDYDLWAASSSRDLRQTTVVRGITTRKRPRTWDQNSRLGELVQHPDGQRFYDAIVPPFAALFGTYAPGSPEARMMEVMVDEMPLRNLVRMGGGRFTPDQLEALLTTLNAG